MLLLSLATLLFWWLWGAQLWPQVLAAPPAHGDHGAHVAHHTLGAGAASPFALALQLAIAVLVVACPCALGLATPTAISVASGRAARVGVLFRGGDVIEAAAGLRTVLFDKTGTLTLGRPQVCDVQPVQTADLGAAGTDRLIQLAASLEAQTRHPLAHALLQRAQELELPLLPLVEAVTHPGDGVSAVIGGVPWRLGRPGWLQAGGVVLPPAELNWLADWEGQGATPLALAAGRQLVGVLAVRDQPRQEAAATLAALAAQGLQLGLLSGDRQGAVQRLGAELGLRPEQLAWELLPQQKLARIEAARRAGPVAMVGDGINDAPALAAADVGIAVGTGTQIAMDTADLVVLGDRLEAIPAALALARRTMATARANLAWAFGYNLVVLPLAAGALLPGFGVLLSPPLAALLMALSSLTGVLNALLLGRDG